MQKTYRGTTHKAIVSRAKGERVYTVAKFFALDDVKATEVITTASKDHAETIATNYVKGE